MFEDNTQNTTPENTQQEDVTPQETPKAEETVQETQSAEQPHAEKAPETPKPPAQPVVPPIKTTQDERMWGAIGYIAFLGIISLSMKPKSEFCKKHAAQGLILFVLWFVGLIFLAVGSIFSIIGGVIMLGGTVLAVLGIVKSIQSYDLNVPVLSDLAKKVPTDKIIGTMTGKTAPEAAKPAENKDAPAQTAAPEGQVVSESPAQEEPKQETTTPPVEPAQQEPMGEGDEKKPE